MSGILQALPVRCFSSDSADVLNPHGWEFVIPIPEGVELSYGVVAVPFPKGDWSAYHTHPDAELTIVSVSGRAEGVVAGQHIVIEPGDFIHLRKGTAHKWRTLSDEPWMSFGLHRPCVYRTEDITVTGTHILEEATA